MGTKDNGRLPARDPAASVWGLHHPSPSCVREYDRAGVGKAFI